MPHRKPPLTDGQKANARRLRHDATIPERLLWGRLRAGRLAGLKFRRQDPVDAFIVDFYCSQSRLAIELDGDSHAGRAEYDAARTAILERLGLRVLRIANDDVLKDLDAVAELILRECGAK